MELVRGIHLAAMRKEICRVKTRFRWCDGSAFFPVIAERPPDLPANIARSEGRSV